MKNIIYANIALLSILFLGLTSCNHSKLRTITNFDDNWKFHPGDISLAREPSFDDSKWRELSLPHDWSIEGEFSEKNPATPAGGALPGGVGWYRKTFSICEKEKTKNFFIDFDGVYRNSEVWINGHYLGERPYGYSSFRYNLTPFLKFGSEVNVISVRVDNSKQPNSRWYSGSGIYRNVWLTSTGKIYVDHWGTYITTPEVTNKMAKLLIISKIKNEIEKTGIITVRTTLFDTNGKKITSVTSKTNSIADSVTEVKQELKVNNPSLWSIDHPYLYKAITQVSFEGKKIDRVSTVVGLRYFSFDRYKGFLLNGTPLKIVGVCDHHDLGCLGAAINKRAIERQLEILKGMGINGIRTSHNPPAPELLDLCDRMGFVVMDEAFDMWRKSKTQFDYHLDWDKWHKRDLEDMVLRDRNHPSIFIWSIGNEIPEQGDSTGITIARELTGIVRTLDKTRPVTSATNSPEKMNYIAKSGALDLIGYNYNQWSFKDFLNDFPDKKFIATETTSALATRGSYDMPADSIRRWPVRWDILLTTGNADFTCSSYDNCSAPWGSTHEETWKVIKKYEYLSGMFIWTGFDYLGEPTPYPWPAKSSYFGIVDMAGFPKDVYYMYQSELTSKPVLHIFPHWNWQPGKIIDIWAYTNCQEVELFLNGKSLGSKRKIGDDLHLSWKVPFTPGILKAVGRSAGKEIISQEIRTAGKPAKIILTADRNTIKANCRDLSFISVEVTDKDGNIVPYADGLINFIVNGDATIAGVDNGNPVSHEPFRTNYRKAFHGLCLLVIQSGRNRGSVDIIAHAKGLIDGKVAIIVR